MFRHGWYINDAIFLKHLKILHQVLWFRLRLSSEQLTPPFRVILEDDLTIGKLVENSENIDNEGINSDAIHRPALRCNTLPAAPLSLPCLLFVSSSVSQQKCRVEVMTSEASPVSDSLRRREYFDSLYRGVCGAHIAAAVVANGGIMADSKDGWLRKVRGGVGRRCCQARKEAQFLLLSAFSCIVLCFLNGVEGGNSYTK